MAANQAVNVATAVAHGLKKQGEISGFDTTFTWSANKPSVCLALRRSGESRFGTRLTLDPHLVLDTTKGRPYLQGLITGKFSQAKMADIYSPDFNKKYLETVKTYEAIMASFSSAKARRKGKGGNKGEVSGNPTNTDSEQVVELEAAAADAAVAEVSEVPPPSISQSS